MENLILWDSHMHSSFSADSKTDMEDMIQGAILQKLKGICFTEHLDPDYPPTPDNQIFCLDLEAYAKKAALLKQKYADQLIVNFGIEYGLQPHLKDHFDSFMEKYPFDFVIGSSHVVHGFDPYYGEFFKGRQESDCYLEYFESIIENLKVFSNFDVYGHIDYIVRYGPSQNRDYSYKRYQDILDEILHTLIQKNIGIELNTGGYHYGLGEPNPCIDVIRRYRKLGGEIITVGADAHSTDKIAFAFDKAANVLKECGFQYYTVFKDRKPEFLRL